jgi:hypothetical protein
MLLMEWLFSWEVTSVVTAVLIGVGFGFLALDDFKLAKLCFLFAAADAIGGVVMSVEKTDLPTWARALLVFALVGSIGVLADWSLKYVGKKQRVKQALLKPPIEKTAKFAVMIPFNTAPGSAPIPQDGNPDDPLFRTYREMQSLAMSGTVPEDIRATKEVGQISWQAKPISTQEAPAFLGKLLQYYIFRSIDNLQRDSMTVSIGYPAEARAGIEPPNAEPYPYERLSIELSDNAFFRPFLHRPSGDEMTWKVKPVRMPRGTIIKLIQSPEGYLVRLQRPDYFQVEFVVKSFAGTGVGQVPKHFSTPYVGTTMQWTFFVTMHYTIEHPEDKDFNPSIYAQWLDALYEGLHHRLTAD